MINIHFGELCDMAMSEDGFSSRVDVNDESFLAPDSMITAVRQFCENNNENVPDTPSQIAAVI